MIREIKSVEKRKIQEYIDIFSQIEYLKDFIEKMNAPSNLPIKKFNFFERHITKRKEFKQSQESIQRSQQQNEEKRGEIEIQIKRLEAKLKRETMRRFGRFSPSIDMFIQELEKIEKAPTFQELGYSSENEVQICLEENGIPIQFDSVEEGLHLFPETACKDVEFMKKAVNLDFTNIHYDKTNDETVYRLYLVRKIFELQRQQLNNGSQENQEEIECLQGYLSELDNPKKVAEGKYKVPHEFMFEELRVSEQPQTRESTGSTFTNPYNYLNVDGRFSVEYGEKLEALYTRQDIIFGLHGTKNTDVSRYLENGLRESTNNNRPRQANNTVSYEEYLTFTNALDYANSWANTVCILGLPKNAFDKSNPAYIWGSDEKNGEKYILPEYILGYYNLQEDSENRFVIDNNKSPKNYRYLYQDATVDYNNSQSIDTEDLQR